MAPDSAQSGATADLRVHLRVATMAAHDLLDAAMQEASGWQQPGDYARFLALQYAARTPVEAWLAVHAPEDLVPPQQTPFLAADLAALGAALPAPAPPLTGLSPTPDTALGVAWVLAGSALGNRAIARQVARIGGGTWPVAFLGDDAMLGFWQALRARIERPAPGIEAAGAAHAAAAIFAHFLAVAAAPRLPESIGA
jgi:heme oxygenase (biliverdin-IX-beta and delta-forming)